MISLCSLCSLWPTVFIHLKTAVTHPNSFCYNEKCAYYGCQDAGNLRKFGFTRKGRQRWQCTTCKKVVAETKGTVFHFQPRTPAMAAGLTDHIRSIKELLWTVVPPSKLTRDG
jgi:transposase-like protein